MSDIVIKAVMSPTPVIKPSNSPGLQGPRGWEVQVEYSVDGESWHTTPTSNDYYVRFSTDEGTTWGTAWYIRGEQGEQGVTGDTGATGATIASVAIVGTDIVFTKSDDSTVTLTGAVTTLKGDAGADGLNGEPVLIRKGDTHIEWKYESDELWTELVALADLKGEQGDQGDPGNDGLDGDDGADGREVLLQKSETHIQWQYDGDMEWTNLVALADLKGETGATGASITSAAFSGSDIVFTKDDANTVTLADAVTILKGDTGATGETGATGDSAPEVVLNYSIDGATLWHETYTEGDLYVRVSTDGESTWSGAMKFIGDDGEAGADGTDGNTILSGAVDPTTEGEDGDFYLNTTSWDVFKKISGEWSLQGNIKGASGEGSGDVVGPETSVGDNFASWDGTGGNTLKDSGSKASDFATASHNHSGTYLESVIDDTTPQLGGNLDVNGKTFTQSASAKFEFGTDEKQVDFNSNNAHFTLVNNTTGTAIDWRKGNKQTIAPTTATTYTFTAPGGACSLILKLTQHSSAVTITWPASVKWLGATPDFATNSAVYIVSFFYDGTNYWGSVGEEV